VELNVMFLSTICQKRNSNNNNDVITAVVVVCLVAARMTTMTSSNGVDELIIKTENGDVSIILYISCFVYPYYVKNKNKFSIFFIIFFKYLDLIRTTLCKRAGMKRRGRPLI